MAITQTNGSKNAVLDTGFDAIYNSGILEFRTGASPGAAAAATGTLLVAITLPADAFAAASAGVKAKAGTWSGTGAAAGSAAHFRLKQAGDTNGTDGTDERVDGTVTATGGGGDVTIDNVSIAVNQVVTVSTFTVAL